MRDAVAWLVAAATGAALWACANLVEGSQEPWDANSYWSVQLPIAALLCFLLGFSFPRKPWRWPIAVMLMQWPVMTLFTGRPLAPLTMLGIGMLLLLSLPAMVPAWLGGFVRQRFTGSRG